MAHTHSAFRRGWRGAVPAAGRGDRAARVAVAARRAAAAAAASIADPRVAALAGWGLAHAGHFLLGCLVGLFLGQAHHMSAAGAGAAALLGTLLLKLVVAAALWSAARLLCTVVAGPGGCARGTRLAVLLLGCLVWLSGDSAWFALAALAVLPALVPTLRRVVTAARVDS